MEEHSITENHRVEVTDDTVLKRNQVSKIQECFSQKYGEGEWAKNKVPTPLHAAIAQ